MKRMLTVIVVALLAALCGQATVFAQGPGPVATVATETPGPDTGEVLSSPASPGWVKAWVSRSSSSAMAISVYNDGTTLSAKFRRFSKEEEEYSSTKSKIQIPSATTGGPPILIAEIATVPVRLVAVPDYDDTYNMVYDSAANGPIDVGFVRVRRGNNQRVSSDAIVRFKNIEGVIDPCNKPPIDDIGEEEEMPQGASANAPGPSLPFTAPIAP